VEGGWACPERRVLALVQVAHWFDELVVVEDLLELAMCTDQAQRRARERRRQGQTDGRTRAQAELAAQAFGSASYEA
jgi:hypothetical protein